jgi:hypothetical protein
MTRKTCSYELIALQRLFEATDSDWQDELIATYGKHASSARYDERGKTCRTYPARDAARAIYTRAWNDWLDERAPE